MFKRVKCNFALCECLASLPLAGTGQRERRIIRVAIPQIKSHLFILCHYRRFLFRGLHSGLSWHNRKWWSCNENPALHPCSYHENANDEYWHFVWWRLFSIDACDRDNNESLSLPPSLPLSRSVGLAGRHNLLTLAWCSSPSFLPSSWGSFTNSGRSIRHISICISILAVPTRYAVSATFLPQNQQLSNIYLCKKLCKRLFL